MKTICLAALLLFFGCDDTKPGLPCAKLLADYCPTAGCPMTIADAKTQYCNVRGVHVTLSTCGTLQAFTASDIDGRTVFYYDGAGKLVAIVVYGILGGIGSCPGGPSSFTPPSCAAAGEQLCAPPDGGSRD
jgi:hypothetical protein